MRAMLEKSIGVSFVGAREIILRVRAWRSMSFNSMS